MIIPVVRHFNPRDVVGKLDTETMKVTFLEPENLRDQTVTFGYSVRSAEDPLNLEKVSEITIHTVSLVFTENMFKSGVKNVQKV